MKVVRSAKASPRASPTYYSAMREIALCGCLFASVAVAAAPQAVYSTQLKLGRARMRGGDAKGAIAAFRAALAALPKDAVALSELGAAALQAGDAALAEESTRASVAAAERPELKAASLYNLGRICEKKGDRAAAIDAYRQSLSARPNATVWRALAALDAKAAAPFDPLAPRAMQGPFPSLQAYLEDHEIFEDRSPTLANPPPPYRAVRALVTVSDVSIAVQLASGWFVGQLDFVGTGSRHNGELSVIELAVKDVLPGGAPEVRVHFLERSSEREENEPGSDTDASWLALVGVGPSGKPSCTGNFLVDWLPTMGDFVPQSSRAGDAKLATVPMEMAADAVIISSLPKSVPARVRQEQLGRHLVVFP
jgi:hypothetical protein